MGEDVGCSIGVGGGRSRVKGFFDWIVDFFFAGSVFVGGFVWFGGIKRVCGIGRKGKVSIESIRGYLGD